MKNILLMLLILVSGFSYSQEIKSLPEVRSFLDTHETQDLGKLKIKGITVLKNGTIVTAEGQNPLSKPLPGEPQAKYLQTLPNGNMVFALPQDNMPCIVPNENASVTMPNVNMPTLPYRYKGPGAIPNPGVPILIKKPLKK